MANDEQLQFQTCFKYFSVVENDSLHFYKENEISFLCVPDELKTIYDNAISIDKICAGQKVYLRFNENNISKVWIWYITEIRESIKLYFSTDVDGKGLIYRKEDNLLENKLSVKNPEKYVSNYTLQDFHESKKI